MAKTKKKEPVILSEQDREYFVSSTELMGRFILMNPHTGGSFVGAPFPYAERDGRYQKLVGDTLDENFFSVDFLLDDMETVIYIPSHVMRDMIVMVEAIKPVPIH